MSNYNKLIKGLVVLLLYILVPYVLNIFLPSITESSNLDLVYRFIFMFLLLLLYIFLYREDIIKDIKAFKEHPLKIIGKSLLFFVLLIIGSAVISSLIYLINPTPNSSYVNSGILDSLLEKNIFVLIIYVFVLSLFTEQIVFRKVFKDIIKNKYFFIIFSGLIYGIFQVGYNISSLNDIFAVITFTYAGIILSTAYEKTDNLLAPSFVYLFYNLFVLSGTLLGI